VCPETRLQSLRIIGITGTPGVGKKSVAKVVAEKLHLRSVSLNDLAGSYGFDQPTGTDSEVDTEAFSRVFAKRLSGRAVVYGHLLPYVLPRRMATRVAVLRCDPLVLKRRLAKRGYPSSKMIENVEAELIGLISADSFKAFGPAKPFEVDTTHSTPSEAADKVVAKALGGGSDAERLDWVVGYGTAERLRSLFSVDNA
jgi:adenylate kinase